MHHVRPSVARQLHMGAWARDSGSITATYTYDDDEAGTGELTNITYSDSTDNVGFTYTRTGKLATVTDAAGLRTFAYQENDKWRTETFDGSSQLFPDMQVKQTYKDKLFYDAGGGRLMSTYFQRLSRIEIGTVADPDAHYNAAYDYDGDTDRMTQVTGPGLPNNGANYSYWPDSHLLWRTKFKQGTTVIGRTIRTYEAGRELLVSVENKWDGAQVSKYSYESDALGLRKWVYRDGTAFSGDHADVWGYNARNELTDSDRYNTFDPNDPNNPSDPNHGFDRAYGYDPIGNRTDYTEGTSSALYYCANELNQYETTDDTTSCPPASPTESFSYDADGNLTEDGTFSYTWDAENRLVSVGPVSQPVSGDKKVEFVYDYMGRRIEKKVSTHNGSSWSVTYTRRFVWSDWLPLLELEGGTGVPPVNTMVRKYTWGLDLGGTGVSPVIDSAGGIGGLLATYDADTSKDYLYFHDANGNVGQLIDRSDGSIAASYEYDAYGNNLLDPNDPNESGAYADDNPFRFSAKYFDDETDLGYWGYRYYSPRLGRWINRDPIDEQGARTLRDGDSLALPDIGRATSADAALYAYVTNEPTNSTDPHGLDRWVEGCLHQSLIYEYCGACYKIEISAWYDFGSICKGIGSIGNVLGLSWTTGGVGRLWKSAVTCPTGAPDLVTSVDEDAALHCMYKDGDLVYYHLLVRNCNHFVACRQNTGTGHGLGGDAHKPKKCCPEATIKKINTCVGLGGGMCY